MAEPQTFRITGMDCADCAKSIERGVGKLDGVSACAISFGAAVLKVEGDVARESVLKRVRDLGFGVAEDAASGESAAAPTQSARWFDRLPSGGALGFLKFLLSRANTTLAVLGALLILPSLLIVEIGPLFTGVKPELPALDALSIAAMLAAGLPIARSAWRALTINREININVLMTIAAIGAVLIGAYTEAGLVMVLFAIGEALEGYTTERARDAIRGLLSIAPDQATVLRACMDCQGHMGRDGYAGGPCPFCAVEEVVVPANTRAHRAGWRGRQGRVVGRSSADHRRKHPGRQDAGRSRVCRHDQRHGCA
jgi:Zn2+/Cd2+-exporting ATPase